MAGVRALVRVEGVAEGRVSRKHALYDHLARDGLQGMLSVVGGKLTAARAIAEEVGDLVARRLGRGGPGSTAQCPLPGADHQAAAAHAEAEALAARAGLGLDAVAHLLAVYGGRAPEVLALAARHPELAAPLAPGARDLLAQAVHAAEREQALHLADILMRRATLGFGPDQGLADLDGLLERVGSALGWSDARRGEERQRYLDELAPMRQFSGILADTRDAAA
jgi:glycerol-3-phosphate dehydrogenase